jgi:hypothetical protein
MPPLVRASGSGTMVASSAANETPVAKKLVSTMRGKWQRCSRVFMIK